MSSSDSSLISDNYETDNVRSADWNRTTSRLKLAVPGYPSCESWFERHDGPTLLVAVAIYASWLTLLVSPHSLVDHGATRRLCGAMAFLTAT
jgi:hypothetical protein